MSLYMTQFSYTPQAWAAMVKNPEDRSIAVKALVEKSGGKFIALYYTFGEYDGFVISEAPDNDTAMDIALAAFVPGHLRAIKTTPIFSVAGATQAMKKAGTVAYQPPKG